MKVMSKKVIIYEDVTVDGKGYMAFSTEEGYNKAPAWKKFYVGMNNAKIRASQEDQANTPQEDTADKRLSTEEIVEKFRKETE